MVRVSAEEVRHRRWRRQGTACAFAALLMVAGCDAKIAPDAPVTWWHDLEGGKIASERPPPPGVNDPYPKIGTVPARPAPIDFPAQQRVADGLAAQRDRTQTQAALDPLPTKPSVPPPPAPVKVDPNASKVTFDAAGPTPSTPTPPAPTPPAPTPEKVAAVSPTFTPAPIGSIPPPAAAIASGPLPELPQAVPTLPAVEGYTPPASPQVAPALPSPMTSAANTVQVAFSPGLAILPPSAPQNLRKFALMHKGASIAVVGHGETVQPDVDAQGRGLELGLKRAQAIAASLTQAGVPAACLRLSADAAGSGGAASLN